MSYHLYLRPTHPPQDGEPDGGETTFDWVLLDAGGEPVADGAEQAGAEIEQAIIQNDVHPVRLIGLVPGFETTFCRATIPGKQARFVQQALPFAVEEQLAQDVETLHLALGRREGNDWPVAAIDRGRMAFYHGLYGEWESAELEAIYPDASLLPVQEDGWTLLVEAHQALLTASDGAWYAIPLEGLAMMFESLTADSGTETELEELATTADVGERRVRVYAEESVLEEHHLALAALEQLPGVVLEKETLASGPVTLMALSHHRQAARPFDLCQGAFAIQSAGQSNWAAWRPVAVVAALWFVLQLGLTVGQGWYYQQQADRLEAEALASYKSLFPNDRAATASNLQRRIESHLRAAEQGGGNTDFLSLMKQAGYQYSVMPNRDRLTFNTINYSQQRGELILELRADQYNRLEALKEGLASRGLNARIGSVVNDDQGTRGRLTISGG